ncbi:MAG: rRNA maturation RNase YbeY [Leptospirales bacterium]
MPIELENRQRKYPIPVERLLFCAETVLSALGARKKRVSVIFVNNRIIRLVNRDFRGKNSSTDVLSFQYDPSPSSDVPFPDGEILISVERANRQAREQGISLESELINLLIHGICHLQGYDHELGEKEAEEMRFAERSVALKLKRAFINHPLHQSAPLAMNDILGKIPEEQEK